MIYPVYKIHILIDINNFLTYYLFLKLNIKNLFYRFCLVVCHFEIYKLNNYYCTSRQILEV